MRTLSKEAEQQIVDAAKRAVALVDDDGLAPDAAVEKVATLYKLGAHKVRLLCHAYNTGRQTAQREAADTALGKFASFPLADAERVVAALYPPRSHAKAASAALDPVSPQYARPPAWPAMRKAAADAAAAARVPPPRVKTAADPAAAPTRTGAEHVWATHTVLRREYESARTKTSAAADAARSAAAALVDYFRRGPLDREKFAAAELAAAAAHGRPAAVVLDFAYKAAALAEPRAADKGPLPLVTAGGRAAALVGHVVKAASALARCRRAEKAAAAALEAHAVSSLAPLVARAKVQKHAADSLIPVPDRPYFDRGSVAAFLPPALIAANKRAAAEPEVGWNLLTGEPRTKAAAGNAANWAVGTAVARGVGGALDKALGGPPASEKVHDAYLDLDDPAHDAELRKIRTQAMLADLMNDEEVSAHPPEDVARAYNEVAQLAPRTSQAKIPMLSLVRRHLEGRLEPHEAQQITGIESGIMGTHAPVPDALQAVPRPPRPEPAPGGPPPPAAKAAFESLIPLAPTYADSLLA